MKNIVRRSLFLMSSAGAVLCLMGADSHVKSGVSVSAAGNAASGPASGVTSSATGSTAAKTSSSLTGGMTSSVSSRATTSPASGVTGSAPRGVMSKPSGSRVTLSPYAEELSKILGFDRKVMIIVKEETNEHIQRLVGYDADNYQIIAPGIAVTVPDDETDRILASLRKKLVPLHYLPFVVEMNGALKTDKIGIIKGTDQYEILRIMHTDGDEYDISNQDVIDRLKEWEKIATFDIIGADSDWVEIEFKTLPKDLKAFAEEVYEFSPDVVEQGAGSIEGLMKEIRTMNRLFLLWD